MDERRLRDELAVGSDFDAADMEYVFSLLDKERELRQSAELDANEGWERNARLEEALRDVLDDLSRRPWAQRTEPNAEGETLLVFATDLDSVNQARDALESDGQN